MDDQRFDDITKRIGGSRRRFLKRVIGVGSATALGGMAFDDVDAARRGYGGPSTGATPNWLYSYKGCNIICIARDQAYVERRLTSCIDSDERGCAYCAKWADSMCVCPQC